MSNPNPRNKKTRRHIGSKILFIPAVLVGLMLVFTAVCPFIDPAVFFPGFLVGLCFPALLLLGVIFTLFFLFKNWRKGIILLIPLLLNYSNIRNFIQLSGNAEPHQSLWRKADRIKVLTYNVQLFGYYNSTDIKDQLIGFLKDQNADIVCLQEYYERPGKDFLIRKWMNQAGYIYTTARSVNGVTSGNVIYSKHKILSNGIVNGLSNHDAIFAEFEVDGKKIRVYNIHLSSYRFDSQDHGFVIQAAKGENDLEYYKGGALRMLRKMKKATRERSHQIDCILSHLNQPGWDGPVLVCGDMNDQPISYTYRTFIKDNLTDAFITQGKGLGQTYEGFYPSYRIDYILYKGCLKSLYFNTHKVDYSDHRPVSSIFEL